MVGPVLEVTAEKQSLCFQSSQSSGEDRHASGQNEKFIRNLSGGGNWECFVGEGDPWGRDGS